MSWFCRCLCIQLSCCTAQRNWNTGSAQPPSCRLLTRSSWPTQQPHWLCLSLPICHLCIQGASAAHVQEESVALLQRRALFSSCIRIYMSASEMVPDLSLQLAAVVDRNMPSEMGSVGKNCCCVSVWLHLFRSSLAQVRVPIEENQFSFRDQWGYKLARYYKATKFLLLQFYWCLSSAHRVSFVTFLKAWDGKLCKTKSKAMRQWKFSSMLSNRVLVQGTQPCDTLPLMLCQLRCLELSFCQPHPQCVFPYPASCWMALAVLREQHSSHLGSSPCSRGICRDPESLALVLPVVPSWVPFCAGSKGKGQGRCSFN